MANVDRANGFRPSKSLVGAPWTSLVRSYPAAAGRTATNNSGDIYIGDVVTLTGGNAVAMDTAGSALGVVVAVGTKASVTALNTDNVKRYYDPDNLSKRYLAHDEDGYVGVVPAEACLFSVQTGEVDYVQGDGGGLAITTTGERGSRTTGNSKQSLTSGADVTIVELEDRPDNDITAVNSRCIVKFNKHVNNIDA